MKKVLILLSLLVCAAMAYGQVGITGTVTSSDDGSPLPGVNVAVQGTTIGTITNLSGEYEITIDEGAVLVLALCRNIR